MFQYFYNKDFLKKIKYEDCGLAITVLRIYIFDEK